MLQNPLSAPKNFFLLVLLLCTTGIYFIMLLITLPHLRDAAGGMYPLDMRPLGYDSTYISSLFDALGDDGRRYYLTKQLPLDMLYPGLFALTYTLSIATLQTALRWDSRPNRILRLAPVLTGVFDYLENFTALLLLALYPRIPGFIAQAGNAFTLLKSLCAGISLFLFCGMSLILILRYVQLQRRARPLPSV